MNRELFDMSLRDYLDTFGDLRNDNGGENTWIVNYMSKLGATQVCDTLCTLHNWNYLFDFHEEGLGSLYVSVGPSRCVAAILASDKTSLDRTQEKLSDLDKL